MKRESKYKSTPDEIKLLVAASSAITAIGVANGRNIPVIFVSSDENKKIDDIIAFHENIKEGNCITSWGLTDHNDYAVLYLDFQDPIKQKVILFFDIIRFGIVVEQIMYSQCMFLTIGDEKSKLSLCIDQKKLLVDVFCDDFKDIWSIVFRDKYSKYLRKKYKLSKKQSCEYFDKILKEWDILKKFRFN